MSLGMLYYLISFLKTKSCRNFCFSIIFLVGAIAAYPMGITFISAVVLCYYLSKSRFSVKDIKNVKLVSVGGLIFIGILHYLTPGIISAYTSQVSVFSSEVSLIGKIIYYGKVLFLYDPLVLILGVVGLVGAAQKHKKLLSLILAFAGFSFLPYLFKSTAEPRYAVSLFIMLTIGTAFIVDKILQKVGKKKYAWVVVFLIVMYPAILNFRMVQLMY
ncbi:MAG: hypothetical protein ACOX6V_02500 [Patescibacteria group bacterium]|jgi:hypothetical protein